MLYTSRYQLPPPLEIQMILVWTPLARVDVIHYKIETEQAQWLHYNFYFGKSHVLSFKSTGWVKYKSKFKVSHTTIQIITPTLRLVRFFLLWGRHLYLFGNIPPILPPTRIYFFWEDGGSDWCGEDWFVSKCQTKWGNRMLMF